MDIPIQVIYDDPLLSYKERDLTQLDDQRAEIEQHFRREGELGFDLERGPTIRFCLLKLSPREHLLLANLAALSADGWTLKNLVREVSRCYRACLRGEELDDDPVQYVQFAEWQNELLEGEESEAGREYWRKQQAQMKAELGLPFEEASAEAAGFRPATIAVVVERDVVDRINAVSGKQQAFLLACWQSLLYRLTRQREVVIHTLFDGRKFKELHGVIGCLAKYIPVYARLDDDSPFHVVLEKTVKSLRDAHLWQEYFSGETDRAIADENGSPTSLDRIGFAFDEWPAWQAESGVRFSLLKQYSCSDRLKLRLACVRDGDSLTLEFHYDSALYQAEDIRRLAAEFNVLLMNAAVNPKSAIGDLELLSQGELHRLLVGWNDTTSVYRHDSSLHELFQEQVNRTPDACAVQYQDEQLTFRELNRRANQLAHHLREAGVGPDVRVGILIDRSPEMVVGLLGILKAGGAYVPLDPNYPKDRLAFILDDAGVSLVVSQTQFVGVLFQREVKVICIDDDRDIIDRSDENLHDQVLPDNVAYIIYTSGSSGKPKGVIISHRSAVNLLIALERAIYSDFGSSLRVSLNAPLVFDASVKQLLQLLNGRTVCILPEEVRRDPQRLLSYLKDHGVEVLDCTPSQLRLMLADGLSRRSDLALKLMLVGGEMIDEVMWQEMARLTGINFYNVYGPTECTVDATVCRVSDATIKPTIGRPISNTHIYILDGQGRPVPIGGTGELCISGLGLARGYINSPDLTALRFSPHPFSPEPGARLYKTGDLARHWPDGRIELVGRIDHQVKIRGYRVEPGEVEAVLLEHPGVREAAVLAREHSPGDQRLAAYVVCNNRQMPIVDELRSVLKQKLPEQMLPQEIVVLAEMPLTRNGKLDREALLLSQSSEFESERNIATARTPIEELLVGIWKEVLGSELVGIYDNFFELGGHSLLMTQVISRVREAFQIEMPLRNLFEALTVAGLAEKVEAAIRGGQRLQVPPIRAVPRDRELPLSFAQQRLWFIDQLEPGSAAYNCPAAVRLNGRLDVEALKQTLNELIRRHEVLRTAFPSLSGRPAQQISPAGEFDLSIVELDYLASDEREVAAIRLAEDEAKQPFDLARGPLVRATLLRLDEDDNVLLMTLHHIVSDGWSMGVLINEMASLYTAFSERRPSPLPEMPVQYADFAHWQREWLQGEMLQEQLRYWKRQLAELPVLELPTDRPRPAVQSYQGDRQSFRLSASLTKSLRELSRREGVTLFMTLLAGFQALLHQYTGQEDIVIGTVIAGRNRIEIENLIGFFLNTLVLRTDLSGTPTFRELLHRVRDVTLEAHAHQELPFEKLVEELQPERTLSHIPLVQVAVGIQNLPVQSYQLPNLTMRSLAVNEEAARLDLTLWMEETFEGLQGNWTYRVDLFDADTITRMSGHFERVLHGVVAHPEARLNTLEILTEAEKSRHLGRKQELKEVNLKKFMSIAPKTIGETLQ
jgi:amino acid adenylation domain-containing protein